MADFDLSLVATFDTQSVEAGAGKVADGIERMSAAEYRAAQATTKSVGAADAAAKAERDHARALDAVKSAIDPAYAAQQRMNVVLAQARDLHKQDAISLAQLTAVEKLHAQALKGGATSAGQARGAYTQLGFQIQDITQTLAMGVNPMVVFGQQAGQTAAAVAGMGGKLGAVGTFLAGPFGSLILGAVTVLGLLAASLFKSEEASDDLSDALDFQTKSTNELTKAISDQLVEARKSVDSSYAAAEAARVTASANLQAALATRERTKALLDLYAAETRSGPTGLGGMGQQAAATVTGQFAGDVAKQDVNITRLEELLRLREVPLRRREAEAATDKATAATLRYEKSEARLQERLRTGEITGAAFQAGLEGLIRTRERDIKAIRESERAQKKQTEAAKEFGREVNTAQARSIADAAGFRTTSGDRTFAEQTRLYNTVRTKENPVAKPGTSAHEKGGALDIAFGPGVTAATIKEAFRKEGVTLSKVLKETGHYHIEWSTKGADKVEREAERLAEFGDKAAESIKRLSERFDEQPRLIDNAAQAARALDDIIADLAARKPAGFEQLIKDAQDAKSIIADSLLRPFEELIEASERRMQIDKLIAAGREDEADALQIIWGLERDLGPLSRARKQEILDTVVAERELTEELRNRQELQDAFLDATRSARQEVEAILAGQGKLANFGEIFKKLKARVLTEQIFGGVFRDLEKFVKEETAIKSSVDIMAGETERAGKAAGDFADELANATATVRSGGSSDPGGAIGASGSFDSFLAEFDAAFGGDKKATPDAGSDGEIVVTAIKNSAGGLSPERYFEEMTKRLVKPLLGSLDKIFGTKFFGKLEGVASGALNGYATGGIPGGIIGALKGIEGLPQGISDALGKAGAGAATGSMVSGIGNSLGLKMNTTGAQIGGAIGSFIPIPGGQIIGSIAGGLLGNLFEKRKRGSGSVTNSSVSANTNDAELTAATNDFGGSIQAAIAKIADSLGAQVGAYDVGIGRYKDYFQVSNRAGDSKLGNSYFGRDSKDSVYDGLDAEAAMRAAIGAALSDGAVKGLSAAVERALKSSPDLDAALAEAIGVSNLEKELRGADDALAGMFDEVNAAAAKRLELARKYGLDLVAVEKLNAKERQALLDEALERSTGSLKRLVDDLQFGSLAEGTPGEKRKLILSEIDLAKSDSAAGIAGANDRLAELQRQLVESSRASFGTAGSEYGDDRAQALSTAKAIIEAEQKRIADAAAATQQGLALANETNDLLAGVNGRLDTLIGQSGGGTAGGGVGAPSAPDMGIAPGYGGGFRERMPVVAY